MDFSCKIDIDLLTQSKLPQSSRMPVSPAGLCPFIPHHQIKLVTYSDSESDFDSLSDSGSCYLDIKKRKMLLILMLHLQNIRYNFFVNIII